MPFCNSCGTNIEPGAKFCPKCGKPAGAAATAPTTGSAGIAGTPAAASGNNAVKIILIVVAVIVGLGVLGTIAATLVGLHIARKVHVEEKNGKVKVQSPYGTVETSDNPADMARNLGAPLYPGARASKDNSADITFGGKHTTTVQLETDDAPDKVAAFYREHVPNLNVNTTEGDHYTMVSTSKDSALTINIEPEGGKTKIVITNVSGEGAGHGDSE